MKVYVDLNIHHDPGITADVLNKVMLAFAPRGRALIALPTVRLFAPTPLELTTCLIALDLDLTTHPLVVVDGNFTDVKLPDLDVPRA